MSTLEITPEELFNLRIHKRGKEHTLVGDGSEKFLVKNEGLEIKILLNKASEEDISNAYAKWCLKYGYSEE